VQLGQTKKAITDWWPPFCALTSWVVHFLDPSAELVNHESCCTENYTHTHTHTHTHNSFVD
jgi:hypothetical protein